MPQVIPSDGHAVGDTGHTADHNNISDMLGLLSAVVSQASGPSTANSTTPPAAGAVAALQSMNTNWSMLSEAYCRFRPEAYGAKADGVVIYDAAITSGLAVLTSATANFTAGDVGKQILIAAAGAATGSTFGTLATTISGFTNSTTVTLAANATTTVASGPAVYGTDDTAAIKSAVTAATNFALNDIRYAEIIFGAQIYMIAGAPTQGGATKGNAVIPLPYVLLSAEKLSLVFRGTSRRTTSAMYALNSLPLMSGTTLVFCRTDGSLNGTFGPSSVFGGPTFEQIGKPGGANTFSNLRVTIDGLSLVMPLDSTYTGFDFYGLVSQSVISLNVTAFATPAQQIAATLVNTWATGLRSPSLTNDGSCFIGEFTVSGIYSGATLSEHITAFMIVAFWCRRGIVGYTDSQGTTMQHCSRILYACLETNINQLFFGDGLCRMDINTLDMDNGSGGNMIQDPSNLGMGDMIVRGYTGSSLTVSGGTGLRIINGDQARGHVTAPGVPATTTPFTSTFWRDAAVTVVPGASTCSIAVDGTATGLVLASSGVGGTVFVPSGKSITLTYASAPTWNWVLL
jgi:hypothetical protein